MSQAPVDPFALVNMTMTQDEMQHRRRQQMLDDQYRERVFARKQLSEDRARNDAFYMNTQGRMDKAFWENMSKSMSEMTFGATMADIRAQRAAGTPPLFLFNDKDIMPNPNADQLIAGAGPGAKGTMPGLIPKAAADRAKEGEAAPDAATTDEPVAGSITPEKPEPDGTTATPQQQAVQQVRNRAAQGQQRAAGPQPNPGMQSPRSNINSMHVDPVTGQWFANVQGQFLPVDKNAMSMIQDWQKMSIAAYAAETKRINSETARKGLATQESLLGELIADSNHNSLMAFLDQFPNTPDDMLALLQEGASTIKGKAELFDRHLGEIASAMQAGDQAGIDAAVFALNEHVYDTKQEKLREELKYQLEQADIIRDNRGNKKDEADHRAQARILRNEILAQARPSRRLTKRPPSPENIDAVVSNSVNEITNGRNYDAMIKMKRDLDVAIKHNDMDGYLEAVLGNIRERLQAAGHDPSQVDELDMVSKLLEILGSEGNYTIISKPPANTQTLGPGPQNMSNETAAPSGGGESEAANQTRLMYEDWLRRNNLPPGPQTYEEFQRTLTGETVNPASFN